MAQQGLMPWTERKEDPAERLADIMHTDNRLMQQARTSGLQQANQRGLLSSSMAVGAAQDAQTRSMVPLALQGAQQASQANLSRQNFEQGRVLQGDQIAAQKSMQLADIASREGMAAAQRELDERMQGASLTAQQSMQIREIGSREGMAAADRALQQAMQGTDIASRRELQGADLASREREAELNRQTQLGLQRSEQEFRATQTGLDRELQSRLAAMNLGADEQKTASGLLAENARTFENTRASIMQNTRLSQQARQDALDAIAQRERQVQENTMAFFDVELDFA